MRPQGLFSRLFLYGGDPKESADILACLGFLDGQTTNPSLIAKNPVAKARMEKGERFNLEELTGFYQQVVGEVSKLVPQGSVSIEVYADKETSSDVMLTQARAFYAWIPNAHIKFPTTKQGLIAASQAVLEGMRVNMTLVFTQAQAAAVYAATRAAKKGQVFVSPFVGRLDDRGENGMQLIDNIMRMFRQGDGHVEVLTASVRTYEHFRYALFLKSDIITAPYKILTQWCDAGMILPGSDYQYDSGVLTPIVYEDLDLGKDWQMFDLQHELTDKGLQKFADDWNSLLK